MIISVPDTDCARDLFDCGGNNLNQSLYLLATLHREPSNKVKTVIKAIISNFKGMEYLSYNGNYTSKQRAAKGFQMDVITLEENSV